MSYLDNPGNQLVRQTVRLQQLNMPSAFMTHQGIGDVKIVEAVARFEGARNIARFIIAAEQAKAEQLSYRAFAVGAAALAVYFSEGQGWTFWILTGANAKPVPGDDTINVHAEHTIMTVAKEMAKPGEIVRVPLLVVAGDLQPDQQTGIDSLTLHPCGICRNAFVESGSPINDETIVVTVAPDFTTYQWFSVAALRARYDRDDESGIHTVRFGMRPLSLAPLGDEELSGIVDLRQYETPEYVASDRSVAEELQHPMMCHALERLQVFAV